MPSAPVIVYDKDMRKVAYLQNASRVGYKLRFNAVWTASFMLPADDPKNAECQPMRFVEIFEGRERVDLFRIMPTVMERSRDGRYVTYTCEHVLTTLIDDILFQHHTIGNLGVYTADVIDYVLSKQTVSRWQLGTVAFNRQFEYAYENTDLLSALYAIPKPFTDPYMWTWDTSIYPWTLNLVAPPEHVEAYIQYGVNMTGITKQVDPSGLYTRIYGLGYGEGVNQLTIAEANGGVPYVEDAAAIAQHGVLSYVFVDARFQYADTLKARCDAMLQESKQPKISYQVGAADVHPVTGQRIHRFLPGMKVRAKDAEIGEDIITRIATVEKQDITRNPGEAALEIASRGIDIVDDLTEMDNRLRISELYAQGATNLLSHDFADNCDPDRPAIMRFFIPHEMARINKAFLSFRSEPFRAYSRAIAGGGALSTTTAAGGGTVVSSQSEDYDHVHGYTTGEQPTITSTTWEDNHFHFVDGSSTDYRGEHAHNVDYHVHRQTLIPHTHDVVIPNHTHGMTLPNHTHGIEYGIFEGAIPSSVAVRVDETNVSGTAVNRDNVDIVPYLAKDSEGRIQRGAWHSIEIAPNSLGRIVANVQIQLFLQSRGGGDY